MLLPLLLTSGLAASVGPPQATHLASISEDLDDPVRIAADAEGNVYVTDTSEHRVCVLDAYGNLLRHIYGIQTPLGIAVDTRGRLYVGDKQTGDVSIFTPKGAPIGKLGDGDVQLGIPTDIAIDSQGRIYVVDSKENCVKVFDDGGNYECQFGESVLALPTGIAVDEAREVILVGQYGALENGVNAAKVQIFDMQGNWKNSIGKYGLEAGEFIRIQGLAIDDQGRIYVTDCFRSTVHVLDYTGRWLSFIGSHGTGQGQLRIPSDVVFDPYNRLWVTSTDRGRIEVFGIDNYGLPDAQGLTEDVFTIELHQGANLISVPLKPTDDWRLSDLAAHIGAGVISIVTYNREEDRALCYLPSFTDGDPSNVPVNGGASYIVIMREGKSVTFHGTAWDGEVTLPAGMSMFAVPLQPNANWQLSDLANYIGEELIHLIAYDVTSRRFEIYIPGKDSSFNANVEGGMGYLAVMSEPKTVMFEGKAWKSKPQASLAPKSYDVIQAFNTPLLVVRGRVLDPETVSVPKGVSIQITDLNTGIAETAIAKPNGDYTIAFIDFMSNRIAAAGDVIQVKATDIPWVSEAINYTLTTEDIRSNHVDLPTIKLYNKPEKSALLPNYPNPFNPETWIPYRLSQGAEVSIEIHSVTGQLVRTLALGKKSTGNYVSRQQAAYWDGTNNAGEAVASGVYFYTIRAGAFEAIRRMVVLR
jgi:DNA-binding beta-propeller fold protein YncE